MTGTIKRVTTNYNLRIPIFDAPGWGREVERNFDVIDAVMFSFSGFGVGGAWTNSTPYEPNDRVIDVTDGSIWLCLVSHVSASSGTFADDRAANPTYWKVVSNFVQSTGPWQASFNYRTNDYMYDNHRYGIALRDFTSTTSYNDDVSDGNIITLIDLQADLQSAQANASTASGAALQALGAQSAAENAQSAAENARDTAVQAANDLTFMYSEFAGGTSGQVLAKASNTDYDYQWIAIPGGGDMLQAIYDTNGLGLDVYDRANHTGEQPMSTITGLEQEIIDLWADIGTRVPNTRTITAGTGLSGGGDLSGDITLNANIGTTAGTVAAGDDSRIVNALSPTVIHALTAKAPPADADEFAIVDSAASWVGKKLTWSSIKAALTSVFLPLSGGTMTGAINMNGFGTTNNKTLTDAGLAATSPVITNANDAPLGSFTYFAGTEDQSVAANLPALGGSSSNARHWNITTFGLTTRTTQIAQEVFGVGTYKGRTYRREKHDSTWGAWLEFADRSWAESIGPAARVNFNGTGTVAIRSAHNVSSVSDLGTGNYRVNFATAMPSANYCAVANSTYNTSGNTIQYQAGLNNYQTTSIDVWTSQAGTTNNTPADNPIVNVVVFGG